MHAYGNSASVALSRHHAMGTPAAAKLACSPVTDMFNRRLDCECFCTELKGCVVIRYIILSELCPHGLHYPGECTLSTADKQTVNTGWEFTERRCS